MSKQYFHVRADKERDVILVLDREAAAVVRTELQEIVGHIPSAVRRGLIECVISEITEALEEQ